MRDLIEILILLLLPLNTFLLLFILNGVADELKKVKKKLKKLNEVI